MPKLLVIDFGDGTWRVHNHEHFPISIRVIDESDEDDIVDMLLMEDDNDMPRGGLDNFGQQVWSSEDIR